MSNEVSNVDLDLTGTAIGMPQFNNIMVRAQVGNAHIETDEATKGRTLVLPLVFQAPATTIDGKIVPPGFELTRKIDMFARGGRTADMVKRDLARAQVAILNIKEPGPLVVEQLVGNMVDVKFSTRTDKVDSSKVYQDVQWYAVK